MKILVMIDPVVPLKDYELVGSTNAAVQLCNELSKMGLNITLACNHVTDDSDSIVNIDPKIKIYNIYKNGRYYMKSAFESINELLSKEKFDSINIHISTPSVPKYILRLNNGGTPIYFIMHSWTGTYAISYYYKNDFIKLLETNKCKFVFLCKSQMETLFNNLGISPKNYIIEPNAVFSEKYNISDELSEDFIDKNLPEKFVKEGYYVTVCRLVRSKHPDAVINACLKHNNNLVVIGKEWINDLDYSKEVKDLIKNNSDKIFLIDELPNDKVCMILKHAKSTILFTDMEVCNLTIMESCLMGTPVVVGPNNTGTKDSIENLKDGGLEIISFPNRSSWDRKLEALADIIDKSSAYRYDVSKFPDCYRWDNHIKNIYKIVTNTAEFH